MPVSFVRRHGFTASVAATALVCAVLVVPLVRGTAAQIGPTPAPPSGTDRLAQMDATRVDLVAGGSEARYRAQEVLSGRGFNEAVGRTLGVQGSILLDADGAVVPGQSKISVDLDQLKSDSNLRDSYIKRSTLQTARYPTADFAVSSVTGLPIPLPTGGSATFQLEGDLTVHGVTRPTTWHASATFADGEVTGTATTTVTISEFGMEPPRAGPVLSIEDSVTLELDVKAAVAPSIADLVDPQT